MEEVVIVSANYKQLTKFQKQIEQLNVTQKQQFLEACCKELAARLLRKVVKRTPVGDYSGEPYTCKQREKTGTFQHKGNKVKGMNGGTLRRGWTAGKDEDATRYANSLSIAKIGDKYHIDIVNPISYASYVEYGHRTIRKDGYGWAEGHHMLSISEAELNNMSDAILQKKLNKFMKDVFEI